MEFFLLAFSDAGDVVFDPFMGSGTTMAAAALLDRVGVRLRNLAGLLRCDPAADLEPDRRDAVAGTTGDETATFQSVAAARGVPVDQA